MHERPFAGQHGRVVLTAACCRTRDAVVRAQLHTAATNMHILSAVTDDKAHGRHRAHSVHMYQTQHW